MWLSLTLVPLNQLLWNIEQEASHGLANLWCHLVLWYCQCFCTITENISIIHSKNLETWERYSGVPNNSLCLLIYFDFFAGLHTIYSETPHEQPPHEQPPLRLLWGHIFRHHYIFLTSHLNVNPWWTATPLTWSEASDFGSSHPWRAATQQLLEVASHGIHGWFGCGLTDIHVNHTSGQPWVHRPKACKGVDHT